MTLRIGSLFSGYGGLCELAVAPLLGGTVAWHCEVDKDASAILDHHYPATPNLGDITKVDWSAVEPVDVLTGGFPCQDLSHAGKRLGLRPGTRSGLWSHYAYAIGQLRPRLVVIENVRGLLSGKAHSDVEPCPWCLGDDEGSHLRALGAVLGDLAGLGYDARWCGVRAADAGAPHGRFRVFVVAYPASDRRDEGRPESAGVQRRPDAAVGGDEPAADAGGERRQRRSDLGREGWQASVGIEASGDASDSDVARGRAPAADTERGELQRRRGRGAVGDEAPAAAGTRDQRQRDGHATVGGARTPADAERQSRRLHQDDPERLLGPGATHWGAYEPAVRRWERLTRPAPAPTEPGSKGQPRLSPAFVEWLMGLPAGHVTDVPISRNAQLKALGNGVVPQQAVLALRWLLAGEWAPATDATIVLPTPGTLDHIEKRTMHAGGNLTLQGAVGGVNPTDAERHRAAGRKRGTE